MMKWLLYDNALIIDRLYDEYLMIISPLFDDYWNWKNWALSIDYFINIEYYILIIGRSYNEHFMIIGWLLYVNELRWWSNHYCMIMHWLLTDYTMSI